MEAKLNIGILVALTVGWATLSLAEPLAVLDPGAESTRALAAMEDRFAFDRRDPSLAERLAQSYLELDRADLAIAILSSASSDVQSDPAVAHRLAQAYERVGRMEDAVATAELALARCGRVIGTATSNSASPIPARGCTERTYIALEMHRNAVAHMNSWGVTDVRTDARAGLAYRLSHRAARIVMASVD